MQTEEVETPCTPYYYASYLLFSLKNSRFIIEQRLEKVIPRVFFIQYLLFSLDVANYIFQQISAFNELAKYKLSPLLYAEYAKFQSLNWYTIEQVIREEKETSKETLLAHIDSVEDLIELWEEYIRKNGVLSFY